MVVGAGYIAVELAGIFNALGAETYICIRYDQVKEGRNTRIPWLFESQSQFSHECRKSMCKQYSPRSDCS